MPRYRIDIEYDGTAFVGWQIQSAGASVQGELAKAVERFSGEAATIRGAGRTDAGVHALGQVAHFDLARAWDPFRVREALNFYVRNWPMAVLDCTMVPSTFDARFSATARHYLYRVLCRRAPPALDRNRVWWLPIELDPQAMHEAAQVLTGRHDFTTFRAAACQAKSPVRTLDVLTVSTDGNQLLIRASARSFLHHQVRSMVGSLKLVGEGKWKTADLKRALQVRDRAACGPVAPAAGLYLTGVDYDTPPGQPAEDDDVDQ